MKQFEVYTSSKKDSETWKDILTGRLPGDRDILEELSIDITKIKKSFIEFMLYTVSKNSTSEFMYEDYDLVGSTGIIFVFSILTVISGKSNFGYMYGISLLCSIFIYLLSNLMGSSEMSFFFAWSVMGYSLFPLVLVSFVGFFFKTKMFLWILNIMGVLYSTMISTNIIADRQSVPEKKVLLAYPLVLIYLFFGMFSIFKT